MGLLSLHDNGFYKELIKRNSTNAIQYAGILQPVAADTNYLLEYIKVQFPEYPGHDIQHSYRILRYLSDTLQEQVIKEMSDTELFCLIMAALFHDTGMALYTLPETDQIRKEHHKFASRVLDKYFDEKAAILQNRDRIKLAIQSACEAHGMEIQDVYNSNTYQKRDKIDSDKIRYAVLASLLRIGDLMDLDSSRVNEFVLSNFLSGFSGISQEHNARHLNVQKYFYDETTLEIEVLAENMEQFRIWSEWLGYMKNEILHINSYLSQYDIHFPVPVTAIHGGENANFEVEELRFEIDDSGGIWKLLSQSIYTDALDFLRELVQNAIDATLFKLYSDSRAVMDHISPRSWNTESACQDIFIGYSEKRKELFVLDSGIGMNQSDLKRFLFKVAGSGYSESGERLFAFPSIAKFGIGFVSCLIHASDIEIFTKKADEETVHHVSLVAGNNQAVTENISSDMAAGTTIHLKLKQDFMYSEIEKYLNTTFLYPSVGITCVDIDRLEQVSRQLEPEIFFDGILEKPYELRKYYHNFELVRRGKIEPYNRKVNLYDDVLEKADDLREWLEEKRIFYKEDFSRRKFENLKKQIQGLEKKVKENQEELPEFPIPAETFSLEEMVSGIEDYSQELIAFRKDLKALKKEAEQKREPLRLYISTMKSSEVSWKFKWKYCFCQLNENFEITNVEYMQEAADLSEKTGIIFLYHETCDFDAGYEYASVNGFLFHDGKVWNSMVRVAGHYENKISRRDCEKIYIKGYQDELYFDRDLAEELYEQDMEEDEYAVPCDEFSIEPMFKTLLIANNKICFTEDAPRDELEDLRKGFWEKDTRNYIFDIVLCSQEDFTKHADFYMRIRDIEQISGSDSFVFCQDGIRFDNAPRGLFPAGLFKIYCNLTANARLPLNVTRHKFSEIEGEIKFWVTGPAFAIQKSILSNVKQLLSDVSLEIDMEKLIQSDNTEDILSRALTKQFRQLDGTDPASCVGKQSFVPAGGECRG